METYAPTSKEKIMARLHGFKFVEGIYGTCVHCGETMRILGRGNQAAKHQNKHHTDKSKLDFEAVENRDY